LSSDGHLGAADVGLGLRGKLDDALQADSWLVLKHRRRNRRAAVLYGVGAFAWNRPRDRRERETQPIRARSRDRIRRRR
jgi:hypothetical protein